jgi:aldehyde dehydrogenase
VATTFKQLKKLAMAANDTMYGLGAGPWTRDAHEIYQVPRAIQAGRMDQYHSYPAGAPLRYKQSGIGRENHKMMLVIPSDKKYANFHMIKEIRFLVEDYSD